MTSGSYSAFSAFFTYGVRSGGFTDAVLRTFKPGFSVGDRFSEGLFLASGAPPEPAEARGSLYSMTGRFWGFFAVYWRT